MATTWSARTRILQGADHVRGHSIGSSNQSTDRKGIITKKELLEEMKKVQASLPRPSKWWIYIPKDKGKANILNEEIESKESQNSL